MRRDRLQELVVNAGSQRALADALHVTPGHISQLLNGTRPFTEKSARKFEVLLRLEAGSLDKPKGKSAKRGVAPIIEAETVSEINLIRGISIPLLDVRASMGLGYPLPEHESVVDALRLSEEWCRRHLSVSNLRNLSALGAYGDSMRPTFEDGDILLVDRGVTELKVDAVYVLQFRDELYVKRVQRRPDGHVVVKSDNSLYDPFVIDPSKNHLAVLGRVVWAWNGRKL